MIKNKKIIISVFVIFAVVALAIASFTFFNQKNNKQDQTNSAPVANDDGFVSQLSLNNPQSISLSQEEENLLKVTTEASTNYPAAMGSSRPVSSSPSTNSSVNNLGNLDIDRDTLQQFEQYRDSQEPLFVDITKGSGSEVASGQTVSVRYRGWLTNGQLFDQSVTQAFQFKVGDKQVISGFEQLMIGMKVGGIRRMVIPPSQGYGPNGYGLIPGNAVLVFDVQLDQVK